MAEHRRYTQLHIRGCRYYDQHRNEGERTRIYIDNCPVKRLLITLEKQVVPLRSIKTFNFTFLEAYRNQAVCHSPGLLDRLESHNLVVVVVVVVVVAVVAAGNMHLNRQ